MGVWIETSNRNTIIIASRVTPCVGVWIETSFTAVTLQVGEVTPCVGVWIETNNTPSSNASTRSHPAWVCGLKQKRM